MILARRTSITRRKRPRIDFCDISRHDTLTREVGVVSGACKFKTRTSIVIVLAVLAGLAAPVLAQEPVPQRDPDAFVNQQRAVVERLRGEFDAQLGDAAGTAFDWGGWYSLHIFVFDDGVESSRTMRRHDRRFWGRLSLDDGAHTFYARVRLSLIDFNAGDSYDGNEDDIDGPNLERGVYRFDLSKWRRAMGQEPLDFNLVASAGRDLVVFGTGITLATPLDHVSLTTTYEDFEFTALAGKTVGSSQDFDLSRTAKRLRRNFLGSQLRYTGNEKHRPFVYALWQRDRNREFRLQPFRKFKYDSFYLGLGSTGELIDRLYYAAEFVYETGSSQNSRWFLKSSEIEAWAVRTQLEYLFRGERKARASVEYLFGSGDRDRENSPTNTIGGNHGDFKDNGFIAFGYRDTGLVLAPRYSNLHTWRVGGSYYPLPNDDRFSRLEIGTNWYLFYKNRHDGAISDPTSTIASGYVGWEMDYFLNWKVATDVSWTTRVGAFFPGRAYSDRTTRTFLLVGMTWSF
jgi:Alginate export